MQSRQENMRKAEYAIYKGEELLVIGTAEECAYKLKVQPKYIQWLTTPTAKRRLAKRKNPNKCTVADRL
ncbi:hypothetical protein [Psychrobacillus sp.]|uniref:hypothetical protein n=1 Tax=Psychrobacillus sp. TaxID=1871623 RepID=UPI0028BEAD02|nr:hypothetical protein [Psychrobacillus sp.]